MEFIHLKISYAAHFAELAIIAEEARLCCSLRQALKSKLLNKPESDLSFIQGLLSDQVTVGSNALLVLRVPLSL